MARKRMVQIPIIKGSLVVKKYRGKELISSEVRENNILNYEHWRDWRKADSGYGKATLRSTFDYAVGRKLIDSYTTSNGDMKVVYTRNWGTPIRRTGEYGSYLED